MKKLIYIICLLGNMSVVYASPSSDEIRSQINSLNQKQLIFDDYLKKLHNQYEYIDRQLAICIKNYSSKVELNSCVDQANISKEDVKKDIKSIEAAVKVLLSEKNILYKKMGSSAYNQIETNDLKRQLLEDTDKKYKDTKSELLTQHTRNLECINLAKTYEVADECKKNFKYKLVGE